MFLFIMGVFLIALTTNNKPTFEPTTSKEIVERAHFERETR